MSVGWAVASTGSLTFLLSAVSFPLLWQTGTGKAGKVRERCSPVEILEETSWKLQELKLIFHILLEPDVSPSQAHSALHQGLLLLLLLLFLSPDTFMAL